MVTVAEAGEDWHRQPPHVQPLSVALVFRGVA